MMMVVKVNILCLKALRSRSGSLLLSWYTVNRTRAATPVNRVVTTSGLDQPMAPARLKPYSSVPKPMVDTAIPSMSSRGRIRSVTFFR
ncbi:hypothetical protein D3C75_940650 [compost metagenome]